MSKIFQKGQNMAAKRQMEELKHALRSTVPSFVEVEAAYQRAPEYKKEALASAADMLRTVRKGAGLTQRALAARMRTSQSSIAKLEGCFDDVNGPTVASLTEVLNYCGMRLEMRAVPVDNLQTEGVGSQPSESVCIEHLRSLSTLNVFYVETDESDRIVRSNLAWQKLHDRIQKWTVDVAFSDFVKAGVDNGLFPTSDGDPEWIEKRMERHRLCEGPFEVTRQDDIVLKVNEARNAAGGVITVSRDVTLAQKLGKILGLESFHRDWKEN